MPVEPNNLIEGIARSLHASNSKRPEKWDQETDATKAKYHVQAEAVAAFIGLGYVVLSTSEYKRLMAAEKRRSRSSTKAEEETEAEE